MPAILRWLLNLLPTNPIVVRLVQGGSRRMRHMYIRSGYLAALIVVLLTLIVQGSTAGTLSYQELALQGARTFELVAYLQVGLICVLTPVFMAGAIAQESNPRTWEVMLTTPLSALQMVLGHLFGRLFFVLALLVCSLPLFAITQYFGGVPGSAILLSYLVSGCAALLVGAIAVALAVNRLAGRRAVLAFYVGVVSYLALTIAVDAALQAGTGRVTRLTALNPFLALRSLLNPSGYPRPDAEALQRMGGIDRFLLGSPVSAWCWLSGGLSVLLILTSSVTVRALRTSGGGTPWYRRLLGLGARDARSRAARTVGHNPIAWREATARPATFSSRLMRWGFVAVGGLWGIGLIVYYHNSGLSHADFRFALLATLWTQLIVIVLIGINSSSSAISREREDGTLDLLLTTCITPKSYLGGKLKGLVAALAPLLAVPLGTLALVCLYVLFNGFGRAGGVTSQDPISVQAGTATMAFPVVLPEVALLAPIVMVPFVAFCIMVGLNWSLRSKGSLGSAVATVGIVGVVSSIVGLCGWQMAREAPVIGPALAAFNPITLLMAAIDPGSSFAMKVTGPGSAAAARISMAVGAAAAAGAYMAIVGAIRAGMINSFHTTTRRLAGTA